MMNLKTIASSVALGLLVLACNTDPSKDKSKAVVSEPAAATQTSNKGAVAYKFSNADSKLSFVGAKVTRKHDGSFGNFSGTVQVVDGDPTKSSVNVDIDVATINADDAKLTGHLKSPDFFDVGKFPSAKFVSTSVKPGGENGATHTITGNLEMHGVTKSITFPAKIAMTANGVDVNAEFAINRKDFSIVYPGMPDDLIKDQVLIKLDIHAKKATT